MLAGCMLAAQHAVVGAARCGGGSMQHFTPRDAAALLHPAGHADTWAALDRRIDEALAAGKAGDELGSLGGVLAGLVSSVLGPRRTPV